MKRRMARMVKGGGDDPPPLLFKLDGDEYKTAFSRTINAMVRGGVKRGDAVATLGKGKLKIERSKDASQKYYTVEPHRRCNSNVRLGEALFPNTYKKPQKSSSSSKVSAANRDDVDDVDEVDEILTNSRPDDDDADDDDADAMLHEVQNAVERVLKRCGEQEKENKRLRARVEELRDEIAEIKGLCKVCKDRPVLADPFVLKETCGHSLRTCVSCLATLTHCPECLATIDFYDAVRILTVVD